MIEWLERRLRSTPAILTLHSPGYQPVFRIEYSESWMTWGDVWIRFRIITGANAFRLRVGDYRIIYRFNASKNEIYVAAVGHRREVYRN